MEDTRNRQGQAHSHLRTLCLQLKGLQTQTIDYRKMSLYDIHELRIGSEIVRVRDQKKEARPEGGVPVTEGFSHDCERKFSKSKESTNVKPSLPPNTKR